MRQLYRLGIATCLIATVYWQPACAEEHHKFTANIGIGAVIINSGNNLVPGGSSDTINDLDHAADKETTFAPLIIPSLSFNMGNPDGISLFLNTDAPIDEARSLAIQTGISHTISTIGILEYGLIVVPFAEAYKNPYLTGVKRETTSAIQYGASIAFNRIMDSNLRMNVAWMSDDVDDDLLQKFEPKMGRDGNVYSFKVNYSFYLSDNFEIRPKSGVRFGTYDGEANNYRKIKNGVEINYTYDRLTLGSEIYHSISDYDNVNPLFNKERDDTGYGASLALIYAAPFGYESCSVVTLVAYSKDDSNINFYDTEAVTAGVMLSYDFSF
jgi:hypothetical protein